MKTNGYFLPSAVLLVLALVWISATASADPDPSTGTILFRWVDAEGRAHYTENFNAVPAEFKSTVVQGRFLVSGDGVHPVAPDPGGAVPKEPEPPRVSNKLEDLGRSFYQEDGLIRLQGKVRNGFSYPISYIRVTVNFLDENENFLRAESTYADPIELQPGDVGTYTVVVRYSPEIHRYQPEFDWKK